jgi:hypothetical protein
MKDALKDVSGRHEMKQRASEVQLPCQVSNSRIKFNNNNFHCTKLQNYTPSGSTFVPT